ncbi:MAG: competence protein ComEA [Microbacteriaceae bacterium]|jgi:competence protein ComEA|nr:competence protein ComEA [Microbacteriaceae bacterium]
MTARADAADAGGADRDPAADDVSAALPAVAPPGTPPPGTPRPRFASARVRVGVGAAVVLLLVGLGCAVLFAALAPRGQSAVAQAGAAAEPRASAAAAASGAVIFVHILGAVARPGLYEMREGARGVDAVAAAGGFAAEADQAGLNLARFLSDGEQIVVPVIGAVPSTGGSGTGTPVGGAVVPGKVNLNTADAATLETLPRVGPAMAARIIAWRDQNGRFTAVEDLMSVTGIGEKTFEGLKDLVIV